MRNVIYVKEAALAGADAATIPSDVLESLMTSEMSEVGVQGFLSEWKKLPVNKRQYFEPKTKT
jgi:transaldolase